MTPAAVAVLLAAGESSRMGEPKQLLPWAGTTLIDWQLEQLIDGGAARVVVVLGANAESVRAAITRRECLVVENSDYRQGRASSLRAGAAAVPRGAGRIAILSVDQPRPAWVTRRLLEAAKESLAPVLVPSYGGHRGHPVVLAGALLDELKAVDEETLGLRAVLLRHAAETETVALTAGPAPFDLDLNTPEDYKHALASLNRAEWGESA